MLPMAQDLSLAIFAQSSDCFNSARFCLSFCAKHVFLVQISMYSSTLAFIHNLHDDTCGLHRCVKQFQSCPRPALQGKCCKCILQSSNFTGQHHWMQRLVLLVLGSGT
mmetsp:Transcript_37789/g.72692  ORF Transcript_37789/g.72692 Transcript_37789/m.72692 type:complete len:108 (+) Transcript_37789:531-854(+)